MPYEAEFDLVYIQDALHELPDPVASLRAAWRAVRPDGRLVVLEWCLPADPEESRTLHGELLWGIQIDELFQGTRMYTHDGFVRLFAEAGVPAPVVIDLHSGATLFVVSREG
jgi:SAM-dependent methyltransferase